MTRRLDPAELAGLMADVERIDALRPPRAKRPKATKPEQASPPAPPLTLPFARSVGKAHDALDRFYTPDQLARLIVERIDSRLTTAPRTIIEPSVGGGAFARAARRQWSGARILGIDIDPHAEGFAFCDQHIVGDWADLSRGATADLVLGNPPFSARTKPERLRLCAHVAAAREAAPVVSLILPWANYCLLDLAPVMRERGPSYIDSIEPRPWPDNVRETAAYEWRRSHTGPPVAGFLPAWR